jgi:hypothetical protein
MQGRVATPAFFCGMTIENARPARERVATSTFLAYRAFIKVPFPPNNIAQNGNMS